MKYEHCDSLTLSLVPPAYQQLDILVFNHLPEELLNVLPKENSTDIHVVLRMNYYKSDYPLIFHLKPTLSKLFNLSNTLVYDTLPAKLHTFCNSCMFVAIYHLSYASMLTH